MKKIILVTFIFLSLTFNSTSISATNNNFTDIPKNHWAMPNINHLVSINVINGFPDGTFKPNFNINIDAFIKMTVTALGYKDIKNADDYWAANYIDKALELGLITKDQFPVYQKPITREEMSSIIVKAIKKEKKADTRYLVESYVKDFLTTSYRYQEDVKDSYALGIITGLPDGTFRPTNYSTRAEASTIIHRMIDKNQRKPFKPQMKEPDSNTSDTDNDSSNELNSANNNADTDTSINTPIEYIHKVEKGKVVYSTEKIMKILKKYPIIENMDSNSFIENNEMYTDQEIERQEYDYLSRETKECLETLFNRDYTMLDRDNYSEKLLYWLRAWWNYKNIEYKPQEFAELWANETEKWKVQQDIIFVTDSYRSIYGTNDGTAVRGRMYFKYNKHENLDNIKYELELPEQMYTQIKDLQINKWYYVDVDVEMGRPMTNLNITWETSKYMLGRYNYLSNIQLVEGQ
ncbi:S-layer homology domain-containing protein [Vallitalea sp.]|jgi:hypothetical protein|uniref:S-layer homology domain-containing protein n=1 Tax=Vallitalea sp. TaxID=1882829 RepID=UPI0025E31F0D|nr:S-layer homology domain-containing protein [Vallitalea sp.]MCT4686165.1 S-layer homology domain-containing protein [Vallitalea sp.]